MAKKPEFEERIEKLISPEYPDVHIQCLIAELVLNTDSEDKKSPNLRFQKIMDTLYGKPKPMLKGEKDFDLLVEAAHIYRSRNLKDGEESEACREAIKNEIHIRKYDDWEKPKDFSKKHKAEIDKNAQRVTPKFIKDKAFYLGIAKAEYDYMNRDHEILDQETDAAINQDMREQFSKIHRWICRYQEWLRF